MPKPSLNRSHLHAWHTAFELTMLFDKALNDNKTTVIKMWPINVNQKSKRHFQMY